MTLASQNRPRMSKRSMRSPSGIKNYQREDINQKPRADSHLCKYLYIDLSSQRSRGWRLEFCTLQRIAVGFEIEIRVLGDLCFVGGEEGIPLLGG